MEGMGALLTLPMYEKDRAPRRVMFSTPGFRFATVLFVVAVCYANPCSTFCFAPRAFRRLVRTGSCVCPLRRYVAPLTPSVISHGALFAFR
jgi:hypothetical protein